MARGLGRECGRTARGGATPTASGRRSSTVTLTGYSDLRTASSETFSPWASGLGTSERAALFERSNEVLARFAVVEDGLANWPPAEGESLVHRRTGQIRVQWCHGAPGIVISAAAYLDEELLLAGAELTWRAGAHGDERGSSICHGTAGNGYAFLKAFTRTGDEIWLERARRFAVHALAQMRRQRSSRGRGRYSLFTGDLGVALYLASCLDADAAFPVLDA